VACGRCGKVKQERLDFLADNPFYTKRFAFYVGRRCRASPIRDVAKELHLDWHTVKALEQQYMREQLRRAGTPGPRVIGLDEVSIRKGHTYRIVVSDLLRQRPIWFGGTDRSEASLDQFYVWLGPRKAARVRLAVMDMWKPFRLSTARHAPQASILFDKFHILRHLGDALDQVRKSEYARVSGRQRRAPKGPRLPGPRRTRPRSPKADSDRPWLTVPCIWCAGWATLASHTSAIGTTWASWSWIAWRTSWAPGRSAPSSRVSSAGAGRVRRSSCCSSRSRS
jgi:transposase